MAQSKKDKSNGGGGDGAGAGRVTRGVDKKPVLTKRVSIEVPVTVVDESAYLVQHLDMHMNPRQRYALRAVFNALYTDRVQLAGGRDVQSPADAARFLLEQVADAMEGK